jgi:serine/threonine protein kinase
MLTGGQTVGKRYRLIEKLGSGGMGSVWLAEHLAMGTRVALKIIAPEWKAHPIALARFRREARAAAEIRSPHVVQILDYDVDDAVGPFMTMEVLQGEDLGTRLHREGVIPPSELALIGLQVGKALSRAHAAGVVHRDLKPENVFLSADEDGGLLVKLLDFGVAKVRPGDANDDFRTAAGVLVGTLSRMSPEQVQGRMVDHRSDLWALGLIAFQCLVGHPAVDDTLPPGQIMLQIAMRALPVPSHFNPSVPDGFDEWFEKSTQVDPNRRFQDAREATRTLAEVCAGAPAATAGPAARRAVLELVPSLASDLAGHRATRRQQRSASCDDDLYYVLQGSIPTGPVTGAELRHAVETGRVSIDTLVWPESVASWCPAREALVERAVEETPDDATNAGGVSRGVVGS